MRALALGQHLHEPRAIEEAEVHALAGQWMDRVRRVADQGEARADVFARVPEREWKSRAFARESDAPEHVIAGHAHAFAELLGSRCQQCSRLRRARAPDQRDAPVAQGQERKRPARQEALPGSRAVRLLGPQVSHHGSLVICPPGAADARQLARDRLSAVGTDHELARQAPSILQRQARGSVVDLQPHETAAYFGDAAQQRRFVQRPLHAQVLDDVAEVGLRRLGGREPHGIRTVRRAGGVPHDHLAVGRGVRRDGFPGLGRRQDAF